MTARARRRASQLQRTAARHLAHCVIAACLLFSTAATAQVGVVASIYSDYRFRGVSLSDGRPIGIIDLSYDLENGLYAALSGRVVLTKDEGPQPLGIAANAGYAFRLRPDLSADLGFVHSAYSHYSGLYAGRSYSECYAGLSGKLLGARIFVSPNYLGSARWAAYGELLGHLDLARRTTLEGSVGVLAQIGGGYPGNRRPQLDERIAISQGIGSLRLQAALVASGRAYRYSERHSRRTALVIGVSAPL